MRRRASGLLLAATILVAAESSAQRAEVAVHDSAGVRISLSGPRGEPFASVASRPDLSLGATADGPAAEFSQITGVVVTTDGSIWVADQGSAEIRVFDRDGAVRFVLGGRGSGPGEFQRLRLLNTMSDDTVVAVDDANGRVTYFTKTGQLARDVVPGALRSGARLMGAFDDGDLLGSRLPTLTLGANAPGTTVGEPIQILKWDAATEATVMLGTITSTLSFVDERQSILPLPFTANGHAAVVAGTVQVTSGAAFRIRVLADDGLVESYGIDRAPDPVSAALREQYLAMVRARYPERLRSSFEDLLDERAVPSAAPAFAEIRGSPDGRVWARFSPNYGAAPEVWAVFGPDRAYLGNVTMPTGFQLEAPLDDSVVGVWTDGLDVQHVRRYSIARPEESR